MALQSQVITLSTMQHDPIQTQTCCVYQGQTATLRQQPPTKDLPLPFCDFYCQLLQNARLFLLQNSRLGNSDKVAGDQKLFILFMNKNFFACLALECHCLPVSYQRQKQKLAQIARRLFKCQRLSIKISNKSLAVSDWQLRSNASYVS